MLTKTKIIEYLKKQNRYKIDSIDKDHITIRKGSAVVTVHSKKFLQKEWVEFNSLVVKNADVDKKLMRMILDINYKLPIGAFGLQKDSIVFKHTILAGDHLNYEDFSIALMVVASISDKYDDIIANQHGGTTALTTIF